MNKQELDRGR